MGQRYVELATSYTAYAQNASATVHVSQLPPNPAVIVPGPAFIFVVVNGVPSVGVRVMLGNGQLGPQPISSVAPLPVSTVFPVKPPTGTGTNDSAAIRSGSFSTVVFALMVSVFPVALFL